MASFLIHDRSDSLALVTILVLAGLKIVFTHPHFFRITILRLAGLFDAQQLSYSSAFQPAGVL